MPTSRRLPLNAPRCSKPLVVSQIWLIKARNMSQLMSPDLFDISQMSVCGNTNRPCCRKLYGSQEIAACQPRHGICALHLPRFEYRHLVRRFWSDRRRASFSGGIGATVWRGEVGSDGQANLNCLAGEAGPHRTGDHGGNQLGSPYRSAVRAVLQHCVVGGSPGGWRPPDRSLLRASGDERRIATGQFPRDAEWHRASHRDPKANPSFPCRASAGRRPLREIRPTVPCTVTRRS